jgi:integrase
VGKVTYYGERIESEIYGSAVLIYKRKDVGGNNWWYRLKIDGVKGYVKKSSKTEKEKIALRNAEKEYEKLRLRADNNLSIKSYTVREYFEEWIEKTSKTDKRRTWTRGIFGRYIDEFMGSKNLNDLTFDFVKGYWNFRWTYYEKAKNRKKIEYNVSRAGSYERRGKAQQKRRAKSLSSRNIATKPAYNTLRAEGSIINEMLKDAANDGYMIRAIGIRVRDASNKADFVAEKNTRRATFTSHEHQVLRTNLRYYADNVGKQKAKKLNKTHLMQRRILYTFVMLAGSCGARVGEVKQLMWSDIRREKIDGEETIYVGIRAETSKVRNARTAVAHDAASTGKVLDKWRSVTEFYKDDDLIFYSAHYAKHGQREVELGNAFKNYLKSVEYEGREEGLYRDKDGNTRTLYSLRHWYATKRIEAGTSVYNLAKSMGTAVSNIQKHYEHAAIDLIADDLTKKRKKGKGDNANEVAVKKLVDLVSDGIIDESAVVNALKEMAAKG